MQNQDFCCKRRFSFIYKACVMKNCSILILFHLCWLSLFIPTFGVRGETVCITDERETLLKLKHHLKVASNRLSSWNATVDSNCCNWVGVVCSNITAHVIELHLNISVPSFFHEDVFDEKTYEDYSRSAFGGEINPCLADLEHLNYLDFSGNYFGGMPFPSFVTTMTSLTHLNLSHVGFDGNIPPQIGNLSNLLYLDLGSNSLFTENIDWVSSLSKLRYLDLSGMRLRTRGMSLPTHLGTMTSLTHLDLSDAAFSGNIPSQIGNLSNLLFLDLKSYSMFPEDLGWLSSLSKLEYLGLGETNLSQSFRWLHNIQVLPSLMHLRLSRCAFPHNNPPPSLFNFSSLLILEIDSSKTSFVPKWIFGLKRLVSLSMTFNNFKGLIPDSIRNLVFLENLDLSYNSFSSAIPDGLYNLHHLKFLNLGSNNLHGTISDVENLTSLIRLDFHDNSIGGALPKSFEKLSSLRYLDLSNNQFNGNPFESLGSLSNLVNLFIGDNCFRGIVKEDNLANFTMLQQIKASGNNLTLRVGPNWYPTFQLKRLHLDSWQLGPNFPSWIQSQNKLQYLRMSNTGISDSIPNWFWERFSQASYLNLSQNHIHGELGTTIQNPISISTVDLSRNRLRGKLPYLSNDVYGLDLSSNSLSGSMDHFLCRNQDKPMALKFLNLASNNLSGYLPNCWKIWPFLVELYLQNNHFIGNLPPSMGSLAVLQSFQIHKNLLSGTFPTSLKKNNQLKLLDLGQNDLSGTIPKWVGEKLLNMKIIVLRSNNFSGQIPNEVCDMSLLQVIDLAGNHLSGNIPTCFNNLSVMTLRNRSTNPAIYAETPYTINYTTPFNMVSELLWLKGIEGEYKNILGLVTSIDLSRNKLSGEIPTEITYLDGLLYLNLSKNQLSGQIPLSIGNMRWLESLDISRNRLSGEIPSTISNLNFLNQLDMSHNHLKGKIPSGTQIQSFEASNFVGNNLCGPPLPINCSSNQQIPYIYYSETKNSEDGVNWFFVSMTVGFIVGFLAVVAPLFIYKVWRYTYFCFLDDMWYKLQSYWLLLVGN